MSNNYKTMWAVKYGTNYQFVKYFFSRENAVIFSVEVNVYIIKPLFANL